MNYSYTSYSQTTTTTSVDGKKTSHTITSTTLGEEEPNLLVCEVSDNELSGLESTQHYEISDDDCLTLHDFYALMNSEDEEEESVSDSDVEDYWFPSLTRNSIIQLLDDQEEHEDVAIAQALIEEGTTDREDNDDDEEEEDEKEVHAIPQRGGKRHYQRHSKKRSKKFRKSEQVPINILHISLE